MPGVQETGLGQKVMEVTQVNLNHCDAAQQLLWQSTAETGCDVAIIAEPYRVPLNNGNWAADTARMAAIQVMGRYPIQEVVSRAGEGFVIAKVNGTFFCSCYAPPRWTLEQFEQMLDSLTYELIGRSPVVIGGDFNAWAVEWGSSRTNARGHSLMEALAKLDVRLANRGTSSTFRKDGRESIIDVTFCSPRLADDMNWRVSEDYTHSDHQAIRYSIGKRAPVPVRSNRTYERKWKLQYFDEDLFVEALRWGNSLQEMNADELAAKLVTACDTTMPRRLESRNCRRPAYWWNEELSTLRASCLSARRRVQRARSEATREERREEYRAAKASLKRAIKCSKSNSFKELCQDADANPWGNAYRVAMAKIRGPSLAAETCPDKLKVIVEGLFPSHDPTIWPPTPYDDEGGSNAEGHLITNEELVAVAKGLKAKKAPGPDGIPNAALKSAIQAFPDWFRTVLQKCLDEGHFPDKWKVQKLVLLPKPGKPPGDPSSYRPICLLDTLGKLLERIILNRLTKYTESEHGLAARQFGFRKGRSTVDAIRKVVEKADKARRKKRRGNRCCAVVTIDVKNAFNSASWTAIAAALHKMKVPDYLCMIMKSYFENRVLIYDTADGQKTVVVTAGVPQGSILGSALWNAMYDGVLILELPNGVEIVGFADDIVLTVTGETAEEVEMLATEAIVMIENWMLEVKLQIAHHKTEMVLVSNHKTVQQAQINVGEHVVHSKRALKYLGVMVDDRLNFNSHVDYVCEKASKAIVALSRIMRNNAGPRSSRRRLLASVAMSILRYGAPAWRTALGTKRNRALLDRTQRLICMRVVSAYRTISSEAVGVIAGMIPIGITLEEDAVCYFQRGTRGIRETARAESLNKWQREWDAAEKGRWTHRLIPSVSTWVSRRHGEVNFHLTQFLSGHGCFRQYLHRFGHAESPLCPVCGDCEETSEHVVFTCPRFEAARSEMLAIVGADTSPVNVVQRMCSELAKWNAVCGAVTLITSALQRKWRDDQRRMN